MFWLSRKRVRRVVAALDLDEPIPGRTGVGRADPLLALVVEEVDVRARVFLTERVGQADDPGLVLGRLLFLTSLAE
jgi:hypothetical protein